MLNTQIPLFCKNKTGHTALARVDHGTGPVLRCREYISPFSFCSPFYYLVFIILKLTHEGGGGRFPVFLHIYIFFEGKSALFE